MVLYRTRTAREPRLTARKASKVSPKYKTKYRVRDWPAYEASPPNQGDVTVWFDQDTVVASNAAPSGRPGGQRRYSEGVTTVLGPRKDLL